MGYIHINNDDPASSLSTYREIFKSLDVDNTGTINLPQYQQFLNATDIPYDPKRLGGWFKKCQIQGDKMAFNEFVEVSDKPGFK